MNRIVLLLLVFLAAGCSRSETPRAAHVILVGCDAMGAYGVQRAETPTLNYLIEHGAVSMNTRCVRPTSSSQNWMSMVSGALPLHHGVTDNDWRRDNITIEPCLGNRLGLFPTIFDHIREQRPEASVYAFFEWTGQGRMYDLSVADSVVTGLPDEQLMRAAFDAFFNDKPDFLFVSVNEPDHAGHAYGHESEEYYHTITRLDAVIGELVARLDAEGMTDNTVLIVTADHGGLDNAHGGDSAFERTTPMIFYGRGVTPGKVIEPALLICDVAATVGGLLGVELPRECVGKFVAEAFTPRDGDRCYVPMPRIAPAGGLFREPVEVTLAADAEGAEIRYTLDGTAPGPASARYEAPLRLDAPALVRAVACRRGQCGPEAQASIRVAPEDRTPRVHYKYWKDMTAQSLPDFRTLGRPDRTGRVFEFSLDELGVEHEDHFAVEFASHLRIDRAGRYTFGVISDDGSRVWIDGRMLIDNDGSHTADMKLGAIDLGAGLHDVRIEYFDDYMGQRLELRYATEGMPLQPVPFDRFE